MKKLILYFAAMLAAVAAPIVFHDGTNVTGYLPSANTPDFFNRPGTLIWQGTNSWQVGVTNYLAVLPEEFNGTGKLAGTTNVMVGTNEFSAWVVRAWTQQEIDDDTAARLAAARAAETEAAKAPLSSDETWKAFALMVLDQFNALRAQIEAAKTNATAFRNMPALHQITISQMRNAFEQKVEERQ